MFDSIKKEELSHSSSLAVWTGLEPATPCVTGMYSNQLNYHTSFLTIRLYFPIALQRYALFSNLQIFWQIFFR